MTWIQIVGIVLIILVIIVEIRRVRRIIFFDMRMKPYSVLSAKDDISVMDRLESKYRVFLSRFSDNDIVKKKSMNYKKYITLGEKESPVVFLFNKLLIGFMFMVLVVVSSILNGSLVSFFGLIISFVIGYYVYDIYLFFSTKSKKKKIKNEMLRAVILMNNSFKAGKSILQAVKIAGEDLPKPINIEFKRIYQDMLYGLSADVAFARFAKRVELEEAMYIASTLSILNKTGGNIVSIFSSIERTLFDKKKLENELKTSAAASNLVVKFLMGVPVVFVLVIYAISPHYFDPLFSSFLGYFSLFIMLIIFIIYIYLLGKIMKIRGVG